MNIRLIGAYLPRLTPERLARHVADDRWRFVNVGVPDLQKQGFALELTREAIEERADEIAEEKTYCLERAALFEFSVSDADECFNPGVFEDAWEPVLLDSEGQHVIADAVSDLCTGKPFRLAFWIHDWDDGSSLHGPNGRVQVDEFQPVPERLWEVAPYQVVD